MGTATAEAVDGIDLETFTWVRAAMEEGFDAAEVLGKVALDAPKWKRVRTRWLARLAQAGQGGELFEQYELFLARAQDCFFRPIEPIDTDLKSWLTFLQLSEQQEDVGEWLVSLWLRPSDQARLARRWDAKLAADEALTAQAKELRAAGLPKRLPKLKIGKAELGAPPGRGVATPTQQPKTEQPKVERPTAALPELLLNDYASIRAQLDNQADRDKTLARFGLTASVFEALDADYRSRLDADPTLRRDYAMLYAHAREKGYRDLSPPPPAFAPAPPPSNPGAPEPQDWFLAFADHATTDSPVGALDSALPFHANGAVDAKALSRAMGVESAGHDQSGDTLAGPPDHDSATLPFTAPNKKDLLTLDGYAALAAKLRANPATADKTLTEFGLLSKEQRSRIHSFWHTRFAANPELRARFDRAVERWSER